MVCVTVIHQHNFPIRSNKKSIKAKCPANFTEVCIHATTHERARTFTEARSWKKKGVETQISLIYIVPTYDFCFLLSRVAFFYHAKHSVSQNKKQTLYQIPFDTHSNAVVRE